MSNDSSFMTRRMITAQSMSMIVWPRGLTDFCPKSIDGTVKWDWTDLWQYLIINHIWIKLQLMQGVLPQRIAGRRREPRTTTSTTSVSCGRRSPSTASSPMHRNRSSHAQGAHALWLTLSLVSWISRFSNLLEWQHVADMNKWRGDRRIEHVRDMLDCRRLTCTYCNRAVSSWILDRKSRIESVKRVMRWWQNQNSFCRHDQFGMCRMLPHRCPNNRFLYLATSYYSRNLFF